MPPKLRRGAALPTMPRRQLRWRLSLPTVHSATRNVRPRITCARALGCCLVSSVAAYSVRSHSTASSLSASSSRLAALLPKDLDRLGSHTTISVLGVQLLLFGGFRPTPTGWQRSERPPASLLERVDLVAPTWKPRGLVDFSWPGSSATVGEAELSVSLFAAAAAPPLDSVGTTVGSLARALEDIGLCADDFDSGARKALRAGAREG